MSFSFPISFPLPLSPSLLLPSSFPPSCCYHGVSPLMCRPVGPCSKVWCEKEMIEQAAWDFSKVEFLLQDLSWRHLSSMCAFECGRHVLYILFHTHTRTRTRTHTHTVCMCVYMCVFVYMCVCVPLCSCPFNLIKAFTHPPTQPTILAGGSLM